MQLNGRSGSSTLSSGSTILLEADFHPSVRAYGVWLLGRTGIIQDSEAGKQVVSWLNTVAVETARVTEQEVYWFRAE